MKLIPIILNLKKRHCNKYFTQSRSYYGIYKIEVAHVTRQTCSFSGFLEKKLCLISKNIALKIFLRSESVNAKIKIKRSWKTSFQNQNRKNFM